jgi:alginate O-acetyltransferase complex protein AlgI
MLFNSLDYFVFLALAVAGFWALARHRVARLAFIVVASCLFYMAANPKYILLVLLSTVVDYVIGLRLGATEDERKRRVLLVCSLVFNLGILAVFKYFDFWSSATASMASVLFGVEFSPFLLRWALPVGISFYTFQTMSYSIDVYRRTLEPKRSLLEFTAFVMFFPQLVAGPIVRASEFLPQLDGEPTLRREQVSRGLFLIGTGLVKKVAVADYLSANLVDRVFAQPELYTGTEVVIALYAFTMQIYCDFSGYTDMARGSALLMGFEIPENFDRPYQATNPAEFWRRWHMTLSRWLRDYLYFPLGGSRGGPVRAYFNLWLTMMLIGMWHGAAWTFVLYGFLQATVMVIHRFVVRHTGGRRGRAGPRRRVRHARVQGVLGAPVRGLLAHPLPSQQHGQRPRGHRAHLLGEHLHGPDLGRALGHAGGHLCPALHPSGVVPLGGARLPAAPGARSRGWRSGRWAPSCPRWPPVRPPRTSTSSSDEEAPPQ